MSVTKLVSGRWIARVPPERGSTRRISQTFDTRRAAAAWEAQTKSDLASGMHVDNRTSPTVAGYLRDTYLPLKRRRPSTMAAIESMIRTHVEGSNLGNRRVGEVTYSQAQAWATELGDRLEPGSVRNLVTMLRAAFAVAVRDGKARTNPFTGVVTETVTKARLGVLSVAEVGALVEAMAEVRPALEALVYAGSRLGLRPGELLSLRVGADVDFLRREVRVTEQLAAGAIVRSDPKTHSSTRTIVLPDDVAEVLSEHLRRFPALADGTIFHTDRGKVYRAPVVRLYFRKAVARAGIPQRNRHPWTLHDLRHFTASVWLAAGRDPMEVKDLLGHSNVALVYSTYGHLMPRSAEQKNADANAVAAWMTSQEAGQDASGDAPRKTGTTGSLRMVH